MQNTSEERKKPDFKKKKQVKIFYYHICAGRYGEFFFFEL